MNGNSFQEGAWWWGNFGPDKTALRVKADVLCLDKIKQFQRKGQVTIVNSGGDYWDIAVHAEGMIPGIPEIRQLAFWLCWLACNGVFRDDVAWSVLQVQQPFWDWENPWHIHTYFSTLEWYEFRLVEKEVAADFKIHNRPVRCRFKAASRKNRGSRYSLDYVRYYRKKILDDGTESVESKGCRKSLVCEYNRSDKIGATEPSWRLELRLQRHHLDRLSLYDLAFDFHTWFFLRMPDLVKFLRRAVEPGTWGISDQVFQWNQMGFKYLLQASGWFFY